MADVEQDARTRTAYVTGAILLMAASFVLVRTGRDALYFLEGGLFDLPKAYIGIAVLSVPFAFGTLRLMRALGPRAARVGAAFGFAAMLGLASLRVEPGGGAFMTALFMLIPLGYGVIFSLSWLLAADLLDGADAALRARAYGSIGAGSIAGGMLGGLAARGLSEIVGPETILRTGAALLALSAAVMWAAQARYPAHAIAAAPREVSGDGLWPALTHRYAALLLLVCVAGSLTGIFVEFQFYLAAATSHNDARENAAFFAGFYTVLHAVALAVQLYLLPRLQRRIGVHGSLLIMPVALLGGAALLVANASLLFRSGLKLAEGGLKASIHRSSWEQAFASVSPAQRAAIKVVIDGAAARIAEGLAAGALQIWLVTEVAGHELAGRSTGWITYAILSCAAGWALLTWALGRGVEAPSALEPSLPLPDT